MARFLCCVSLDGEERVSEEAQQLRAATRADSGQGGEARREGKTGRPRRGARRGGARRDEESRCVGIAASDWPLVEGLYTRLVAGLENWDKQIANAEEVDSY